MPYRTAKKSKIAAKTLNINMLLLVFILVLITVVASLIVTGITNDASLNLARFYSIEAVDKFNAYVSQDLALVKKVAHSKAVVSWFADEDNQDKKIAAYNEMMDYAGLLDNAELYFGIHRSLNEFSIDNGAALEDFYSQSWLDPADPVDAWYFELCNSNNEYAFHMDTDKYSLERRLWINHKVMSDGNLVGVFCSGLKIEAILKSMFAQYDADNVRGYVIDRLGHIQLDSAASRSEAEASRIHLASSDAVFAREIDSYLESIEGYFSPNSQPFVFKLSKGPYRFVAIAPISYSDWSVVTFFNSRSLFGVMHLLPLLAVILVALIFYAVVGGVIINRQVFVPLKRLTESLSQAQSHNSAIFGSERDDEIGELSNTIGIMRDRISAYNAESIHSARERERQDQLLHAVNQAAAVLLSSVDEDDFKASLQEGMELMARCVDVDRIYIWKNELKDRKLYYTQQFDWMNDLGRRHNPVPHGVSYPYTDVPEWEDKFILDECVNGPLSDMSAHIRELVNPCMVQSLLLIPVHLHGYFWGFVNFDDCHSERTFTEEEVNILRSASLMMVNAVNRNVQAAKIEEAHERVQLMLDSTPLGCILWDSKYEGILCNEAAVKLFNLKSKQEFLDRFSELSPEYQNDGMLSSEKTIIMIEQAFIAGIHVFEWTHQMLDGTPIPAEVTLVRISYDDEYIVAGHIRDLREYKQMMKGLEQRDVMLQTVNQAAAILLQSDVDNFKDNLWNCMGMMATVVDADRIYIWKNYTKEGRLYSTQLYEWSEAVEPQQGNQYVTDIEYDELSNWEEKLRRGECINTKVRDLSPHVQESLSPQGILSMLVVPVFLQDDFWGFVGFDDCHSERVFSDNEETILRSGSLLIAHAFLRNEMTLNIRASAARLEAVLSNYSGVIYSVDRNNIITLFNGLYLNKIGVTPSFLEGKNLNLAAKKNRHLDLIEYVKKTFEENKPQDWLSEIDGGVFRAHTMPIFDENGHAVSLVGSLDDITDMVRLQTELESALEKAQDASRAKSNFLSNMSHEIRTPMNAIIGMTYIGKSASSIEKKDYAFDKIEGASNHLLGVINDVLEMSKIEAGKFDLSFIEFNFEKMLQKVVNVISFRVEEKKQKFSVYLDSKIPQSLVGDDQRIAQIITNLLSNAIKFTPDEGSIRLTAVLEKEEAGIFTIKVSVADSGIGINAEQQSRLFSSFEQAESSTSRKFGGTGLGLAISKHIVELMSGRIWVESELGKGAVFAFIIQAKAGNEKYVSPLLSGVDWSNIRLLAVDDDPEVQEYFVQIAESFGIACDAAGGGEEALKLIQNNKYDILFIDWLMPEINGIELSREIYKIVKGNSVIILISASESNEIEQAAREAGVNDFLTKPLFPSAVAGCINKYIGQPGMTDDDKNKPQQTESFLGYRLLLAEDVEINREIVITMLEPFQLEIDSAVNGQESVKMFSANPERYDLIFMDLQMPEMDGYEATRLIRESNFPKAKEIPIIAMTANVFKEDIEKCLEAGMNDHVGKPLDFNEVLSKLRIHLRH